MKDLYSSDRAVADRALKEYIKFIYANRHHLRRADPTNRLTTEADRLYKAIMGGRGCTDRERKLIDTMYEKTMQGAGVESVDEHKDRRGKGLRFGHQ